MKNVDIKDITEELGNKRFIIVGDIHGSYDEFVKLLSNLEFDFEKDVVISLGDILDRGKNSKKVLTMFMTYKKKWFHIMGNHDNKFLRYLKGNKIQISDGLETTIFELNDWISDQEAKNTMIDYFENLPYIIKIKGMYCVHAGFNPTRPPEQQYKSDCVFQRYYGGKDYFDSVHGKYWFKCLPDNYPTTFSGHEVHEEFQNVRETLTHNYYPKEFGGMEHCVIRNTKIDYLLDGGAVFGGELRAYDSRDGLVHSVKSFNNS